MARWRQAVELATTDEDIEKLTAIARSRSEAARNLANLYNTAHDGQASQPVQPDRSPGNWPALAMSASAFLHSRLSRTRRNHKMHQRPRLGQRRG